MCKNICFLHFIKETYMIVLAPSFNVVASCIYKVTCTGFPSVFFLMIWSIFLCQLIFVILFDIIYSCYAWEWTWRIFLLQQYLLHMPSYSSLALPLFYCFMYFSGWRYACFFILLNMFSWISSVVIFIFPYKVNVIHYQWESLSPVNFDN